VLANNAFCLDKNCSYLKDYSWYFRKFSPYLAAVFITPFPSLHPENKFSLWFQYDSLLTSVTQRETLSRWQWYTNSVIPNYR